MITRRQLLKNGALLAAICLGAPFLHPPRLARAAGGRFPILVYHRVGPQTDPLTISVDRFREDLRYLADNGYLTGTFDRLKAHLADERPLPAETVFLTFDDGYADNYDNAFPLLQSFGMTANFFVITALIDKPGRLSAAHIREMAAAGMYFGSHTVTHRRLGDMEKWENAAELARSKADLEAVTGRAVEVIAYPYGSYNPDTLEAAREFGYWGGLTCRRGYADLSGDLLAMRRLPVFRSGRRVADMLP
jgi:peptidoglycan/xylan/chitin deacetylase (PgdA/CDA1 family)